LCLSELYAFLCNKGHVGLVRLFLKDF